VFVATAIQSAAGCRVAVEPRTSRPSASGVLYSADRVVRSVEEKRALRARGADAVDMEAAGVAEAAAKQGIPLSCIRAVVDMAGESLAIDFNAARRPDGRISMARVVAAALSRPWALLPELAMLAKRSRVAARALGDFIDDCEF
jgi:adenosylhomocysteine nucleosidase